MAIFPQQFFTKDNVLVRSGRPEVREDYASKVLARKFAGPPKGVYFGFAPSAVGSVLTLAIDVGHGASLAKVHSDDEPGGMDLLVTGPLAIDFATAAPGDFLPDGVQVLLSATYTVGAPTTARLWAQTKTSTLVLATIGAVPAPFDFGPVALDAIKPGAIAVSVNVQGFGPFVVVDDGVGGIPVSVAMPTGGTVNYETGTLTGMTAPLTALSSVVLTYSRKARRDEVLVCELTGTPAAITVVAVPGVSRDVPVAYPGTDFGFMPGGAVEDLEAAVAILNEVAAARIDMAGGAHPSLKARLDYDLSGPIMASRLATTLRLLRSNDYTIAAGVSEITVGSSFAETSRSYAPPITLNGGGSETAIGVVTDPPDATRNVCLLLDATTGDRLIADATTRVMVFGRLRQEPDFIPQGTLNFTNAATAVTGTDDTKFLIQILVGDVIQGADGRFYTVATVTTDTALTVTTAYQGTTAASAGLIRRRFKLRLRTIAAGVESAFTMVATTTVRFLMAAFVSHAQSNFDATTFLHQTGERPALPDASTTVPGRIALADVGAKIGAIKLQLAGLPVVGGPFHTINFTGLGTGLAESSPGVINVASLGPPGPIGPGAGAGPTGDTGPIGKRVNVRANLVRKGTEDDLSTSGAPVSASFTHDFASEGMTRLGFVSGGIASFRDLGIFGGGTNVDSVEITSISYVGTIATIVVTGGGAPGAEDNLVRLYLDAEGTSDA